MKIFGLSILRLFTSSSAILMFVSFFMPAVSGCNNQPIYPYEIFSLKIYLPYFWGLSLFILLFILNKGNNKLFFYSLVLYLILMFLWIIDWGYTLHNEVVKSNKFSMDLYYPYVVWWIAILALPVYILKRRVLDEKILFRSIWVGALMANSFYSVFITDHHFIGLTISFFSSMSLFFSGLFEEGKDRFLKNYF